MDKINRKIAVLIFQNVNLVDIAGPAEALKCAHKYGKVHYALRYFSPFDEPVYASCGIKLNPDISFDHVQDCDDLLITGGEGVEVLLNNKSLQELIGSWLDHHPDGRIISVCAGALLVARTGILDHKTASTHWQRRTEAEKAGPNVHWDFDRIYSQSGRIFTSAGITAGIDLALHIISCDANHSTACNVARELVVPMQRSGGQSQHSLLLDARDLASERLRPVIEKIITSPNTHWTLEKIAAEVHLTPRTVSRYMNIDLGLSPMKFVETVRMQYAINLLENGGDIATIAEKSGFGSVQNLNRSVKKQFNTTTKRLVQVLGAGC